MKLVDPGKLVANEALRGLVRSGGLVGTRRILRHSLMHVIAPPWALARLRKRFLAHLANYFPAYDPRTARALADAFVEHWTTKHIDDCYAINLPDPTFALRQFDRHIVYERPHLFKEAVERGAGVLAVGAHMGSVSLGTFALCARILDIPEQVSPSIRLCADPEINGFPSVFEALNRGLADYRRDVRLIVTKRDSRDVAKEMCEALEGGNIVTTNLDVMAGGRNNTPFLMFDRARVRLPALVGAAKVALRTGATILPWMSLHEGNLLRIRFEPLIGPVSRLGDRVDESDPVLGELCITLRDVLQGWIRWHPEQWTYWDRFHRRVLPAGP